MSQVDQSRRDRRTVYVTEGLNRGLHLVRSGSDETLDYVQFAKALNGEFGEGYDHAEVRKTVAELAQLVAPIGTIAALYAHARREAAREYD